MKRISIAALVVLFALAGARSLRADDAAVKAILGKALKALGGEAKLAKAKAIQFQAKRKMSFGGNETEFTMATTVQELDQRRTQFESEFNGNPFKAVTVLNKDKGWG